MIHTRSRATDASAASRHNPSAQVGLLIALLLAAPLAAGKPSKPGGGDAPPPTLTFTADRSTYATGESATLRWTSSGTKFCTASGDWDGKRASTGEFVTGPLAEDGAYGLKCNAPGGGVQETLVLAVTAPAPAPAPAPEPEPAPPPEPAPEPSLAFSVAQSAVAEGGSAALSWNAANADSCRAGGGWSGDLPPNGTRDVGPLEAATTFSLTCSGAGGSVLQMLSVGVISRQSFAWQPPTENVDGTALADLAAYRIYYGGESGAYAHVVELTDPSATEHTLDLVSGSYHVAMTALDGNGNESDLSNEILREAP